MKCKAVERRLIAADDREPSGREREAVAEHLRGCAACRTFVADRLRIRETLAAGLPAAPPKALSLKTRRALIDASRETAPAASAGRARDAAEGTGRAAPPLAVVLALVVSIILTAAWLTFALADFDPAMPLPVQAWLAIGLIAENVLVLFFAPVILRAVRLPRNGEPAVSTE